MKLPWTATILKVDLLTGFSLVIHRLKNVDDFTGREIRRPHFLMSGREQKETAGGTK
jgi:hypothetical protein